MPDHTESLFPTSDAAPPSRRRSPLALVRIAVERSLDEGYSLAATDRDNEGLTYLGEGFAVGDRVEVPLGRGDALAHGVVLATGGDELLGHLDPAKLKAVQRPVGPTIPEDLLDLARWVSRYYVAPLGMVLGAIVPAAAKKGTGRRTEHLVDRPDPPSAPTQLTPAVRAAWEIIASLPRETFPIDPRALATLSNSSTVRPINRLVDAGMLCRVTRDVVKPRGDLFSAARFTDRRAPPTLTEEQKTAIDAIWPRDAGDLGFSVHLLHGVTGSGKTEVYLRLLERCLAAGKTALVLVPEIGLTPQTAGRFIGRFPDHRVSVLHSALSATQRHEAWNAAASGDARIIVGARSAVFAPLRSLGVAVVDEEHDPSYKQDSLPRYNGRDVAIKRAQLAGCPVVLGSATPALESWAHATAPTPRYRLHRLTQRVGGATLPTVHVVDTADQHRRARASGHKGDPPLVGPTLLSALDRTLAAGAQAILLLNRRGYAGHLACPDQTCGWSLSCRHCDARMVLHRAGMREGQQAPAGFLRCHHCGAEQTRPTHCPGCGRRLVVFGAGTQRAEEQLVSQLEAALGTAVSSSIARIDADSMRSPRLLHATLHRFATGDLRVLIGTQMIAKGLDYPNVRLVGVLSADTALAIPDFRAEERTFQLVSQVAGRAGRGADAGTVIVQTLDPSQPSIRLAAAHDYDTFASRELRMRRDADYPPIVRLTRIVSRDRDHDRAHAAAAGIAAALRDLKDHSLRVEGPTPCVIPRIADHFRFAVEISAPTPNAMQHALGTLRQRKLLRSDAHTAVDVDPVSLL